MAIDINPNYNISLFNIGYIYHLEVNIDKDYKKAIEYYKRALYNGNSNAMNNLGYMYEYGEGVNYNNNKALYFYELGSNNDNMISHKNYIYLLKFIKNNKN
jgi:TPR repeat protein